MEVFVKAFFCSSTLLSPLSKRNVFLQTLNQLFNLSRIRNIFRFPLRTHQLYKLNLVLQNVAKEPSWYGNLHLLPTFGCEVIPFRSIFLFSAAPNPFGSTFLARTLVPIGNIHQILIYLIFFVAVL